MNRTTTLDEALAEVQQAYTRAEAAKLKAVFSFLQVSGQMVANDHPGAERLRAAIEATRAYLAQPGQTADGWRAVSASWAALASEEEE